MKWNGNGVVCDNDELAETEKRTPIWTIQAAINSEERWVKGRLAPLCSNFNSAIKLKAEKRTYNKMRWYYEKKELRGSPSIQAGMELDVEARYRREGARFVIDIGSSMNLSLTTMATGVVYFHRFYMFHTFQDFPRYPTALGCLFLAGKVEETPKKCKDMLKTASELLSDEKFATFGTDLPQKSEEIMTLERIILQTIKFDLHVEHPYTFLLKYAKCLKGDKSRLQKMVQMAWTFVNDSLCTTLCLQWEPEIVAIALMHLAGKLSKFEVQDWVGRTSDHYRWWDMFVEGMTIELLEDICHQVLDLYSQTQASNQSSSPPPPGSRPVPPPNSNQPNNNSQTGANAPPAIPPGPPPPQPYPYHGLAPPPVLPPQHIIPPYGPPPISGMSYPPPPPLVPPPNSVPGGVRGPPMSFPVPPPPMPQQFYSAPPPLPPRPHQPPPPPQ